MSRDEYVQKLGMHFDQWSVCRQLRSSEFRVFE